MRPLGLVVPFLAWAVLSSLAPACSNGAYDPLNPAKSFEINSNSRPVFRPSQFPFSLNNALGQVAGWQMSGLDDLNTENPLFSRGKLTVLKDLRSGPGIFAYKMELGNKKAFVVFNTSETPVVMDNLENGPHTLAAYGYPAARSGTRRH